VALCLAFSPDGKTLSSGYYDRTVRVWNISTGQETLTLKGHNDQVSSVAFSPDGTRLASASGPIMKVWDALTGQEILTLKGHNDRVSSVAFSPDGKRLASASEERTVRVWDARPRSQASTPDAKTR
jgi:WD40 repeat protein